MSTKRRIAVVLLSIFLVAFVGGCKKPPPPPPPPPPEVAPPPPPPPKPEVTLSAEPSSIERGKSATLKWSSKNATSATLNQGIGAVPPSGSREVFPTQSTSYEIIVKGAGGEAMASARVEVRVPPPPPPPPPVIPEIGDVVSQNVRDAHFDYDESNIRADAEATLRNNASALKKILADYSGARIVIEGHCDERGTSEYNLALGDRRSTAARDFLISLGVSAGRLTTISYGKERPQCGEEHEGCWQRNRRAHFGVAP